MLISLLVLESCGDGGLCMIRLWFEFWLLGVRYALSSFFSKQSLSLSLSFEHDASFGLTSVCALRVPSLIVTMDDKL